MKSKKIGFYTAATTAAALFSAIGTAGLAYADGHDDDDDEDEDEDDDDHHVVRAICDVPTDAAALITSEVTTNPAVVFANRAVTTARAAYDKAVAAQAVATANVAAHPVSTAKTKTEKALAKKYANALTTAKKATSSALTKLKKAQTNYTTVQKRVDKAARDRYGKNHDCIMPSPTDPVTPPVDPVTPPVDPVTPPVDPVTPPVDPVTPPVDPVTPPVDPTPVTLAAPTNVKGSTATSLNTGAFRLEWTAVSGATSYKIFRGATQIGTSTTTTFTPTVTAGVKDSYTVVATNGTVDSPASTAVSAGLFTGTSVADKRGLVVYGQIQVSIAVTNNKVTGCWATYPTSSDSGSINRQAIPMLCSETLTKQTALLSSISGATATVPAFKTSLQAALTAAGI